MTDPLNKMEQQAEPAWKLAPLEPDGRMWSAGRAAFIMWARRYEDAPSSGTASVYADVAGSDIYRAMLLAAPVMSPASTDSPDVSQKGGGSDMSEVSAIRNAALEAAATVAEAQTARRRTLNKMLNSAPQVEPCEIAAAIRALRSGRTT